MTNIGGNSSLTPRLRATVAGEFWERKMNGCLLVAVCSQNDVPLRLYDEHGQHAATVEADACSQAPERAQDRYPVAFKAVGCWSALPPYAFRVLQITGGEVVGCVYDTDADAAPTVEDSVDYD